MNFFICSGVNPLGDLIFPSKVNNILNGCILMSLLLHLVVRVKVSVFKWKTDPGQNFTLARKFTLNFENQSLSDFATNFFIISMFGGVVILLSIVHNFSPAELNNYPNYYYVYGLHMFAPIGFGALVIVAYYFRHKPLLNFTRLEFQTLLERFGPLK